MSILSRLARAARRVIPRRQDETEYLLSSPENARRLREAAAASHRDEGRTVSVDQLRQELRDGRPSPETSKDAQPIH